MSVPFWNDLAVGHDGPVIDKGRITVPEKPGLGVTLNLDLAREYARPDEPFFDE
jgi:gluconate/galactonate dehydratase